GSPTSCRRRLHRPRRPRLSPAPQRGNETLRIGSYHLLRNPARGGRTSRIASSKSIALFPVARGESAPATNLCHPLLLDGPATPPSVLGFGSPKSSSDEISGPRGWLN